METTLSNETNIKYTIIFVLKFSSMPLSSRDKAAKTHVEYDIENIENSQNFNE